MKLARRIWAICSFLITTNATVVQKTRPRHDPGSDHIAPALSLVANLQPINTTHVNISLTNTYPQQLSILKWNSHFQSNQNAAHGSFQLTQRLSNGSVQILGPGSRMGRFRYMDPVPSHFFNLTAGATYINSFDITRLFSVPQAGIYNITMDFTRPATLVPSGATLTSLLAEAKEHKGKNSSSTLHTVRVKSDTSSVNLQPSSPIHISQKRRGSQVTCTNEAQSASAVLKARGHARSLAKFAQAKVLPPLGIAAHGLIDDGLWVQYFKNDTAAKNVSSIYNAIASYGLNGQNGGITEYCDLNDADHMCTDDGGVISYSTSGDGSTGPSLTFCSPFFTLPVAETCSAPGFYNNIMTDQGGIYLHELAKCQPLTKVANITDGADDDCWTWDCITSAAANRNGEKAWLLAGAYELFAYAARAQVSSLCPNAKAVGPQTQPGPPGGPPGEQRLPGVQRPVHGMPGGGLRDGGGNEGGRAGMDDPHQGTSGGSSSGGGSGGSSTGNDGGSGGSGEGSGAGSGGTGG